MSWGPLWVAVVALLTARLADLNAGRPWVALNTPFGQSEAMALTEVLGWALLIGVLLCMLLLAAAASGTSHGGRMASWVLLVIILVASAAVVFSNLDLKTVEASPTRPYFTVPDFSQVGEVATYQVGGAEVIGIPAGVGFVLCLVWNWITALAYHRTTARAVARVEAQRLQAEAAVAAKMPAPETDEG